MRKAIVHLKNSDPVMARIIKSVGAYAITYRDPDFTSLARSITYQQLSGKAAATIFGRVMAAAGRGGRLSPRRLLALGPEGLRPLGLSGQKASYILDLAGRTARKEIRFEQMAGMTDREIIDLLTQIKGVGVWTAHMFLMFTLRRLDVLPVGDLGIRNAIQRAYQMEIPPSPKDIEELGQRWRPYASVASWYLWRSLDGEAEL